MRFVVYDKETMTKIKHIDFMLSSYGILYDREDMCEYSKNGYYIIKIYLDNKCIEFDY